MNLSPQTKNQLSKKKKKSIPKKGRFMGQGNGFSSSSDSEHYSVISSKLIILIVYLKEWSAIK